MNFKFHVDTRALQAIADQIQSIPTRRADRIAQIIRDGVVHNYDALAYGASIPTVDGSSIQWSRVRSRMTIAIRMARGLGALFPILTLTGKLRRGLVGGTYSAQGNTFVYRPATDVKALVATHQTGGPPLPSMSSRAIFQSTDFARRNVPQRETLFWSRQMADQMKILISASVRGGLQ